MHRRCNGDIHGSRHAPKSAGFVMNVKWPWNKHTCQRGARIMVICDKMTILARVVEDADDADNARTSVRRSQHRFALSVHTRRVLITPWSSHGFLSLSSSLISSTASSSERQSPGH